MATHEVETDADREDGLELTPAAPPPLWPDPPGDELLRLPDNDPPAGHATALVGSMMLLVGVGFVAWWVGAPAVGTFAVVVVLLGALAGLSLTRTSSPGMLLLRPKLQRASQLHLSGDLAQADQVYRELLEHDDARPAALRGMASLLTTRGRLDEALAVFSHLYRRDHPSYRPWHALNLAEIYARKNDVVSARAAQVWGGDLEYSFPEVEALILCREGDYDAIVAMDRERFTRWGHFNELFCYLYAYALWRTERVDEMADVYEQCIAALDCVSKVHVAALVDSYPDMEEFAAQLPWPERPRRLDGGVERLAPARVVQR